MTYRATYHHPYRLRCSVPVRLLLWHQPLHNSACRSLRRSPQYLREHQVISYVSSNCLSAGYIWENRPFLYCLYGIMPIRHCSGAMIPGQLGPTSRLLLCVRNICCTLNTRSELAYSPCMSHKCSHVRDNVSKPGCRQNTNCHEPECALLPTRSKGPLRQLLLQWPSLPVKLEQIQRLRAVSLVPLPLLYQP